MSLPRTQHTAPYYCILDYRVLLCAAAITPRQATKETLYNSICLPIDKQSFRKCFRIVSALVDRRGSRF